MTLQLVGKGMLFDGVGSIVGVEVRRGGRDVISRGFPLGNRGRR